LLPSDFDFPGNYAVFHGKRLIYIGESVNVNRRLRSHIRMAHFTDWWHSTWGYLRRLTIAVRPERVPFERMMVESRLIARLHPIYNIMPGRFRLSARERFVNA